MGFFVTQAPAEIKKPVRAPKAAKGFDPHLRGCDHCVLRDNWSWITSSRMELSGNLRDPDVLILGDAPDEDDDKKGIPFIGDAGRMIRRAIPGRELDRCAYGHVVRCRTRDDAPPPAQALHACSIHLEDDLAQLPSIKLIIGIGQAPLNRFFPGTSITRIHGLPFPIQMGERVLWYCPIIAPSYINTTGGDRSPALPQLKADIKRAFAEFERWGKPRIYKADPDDVLYPQSKSEAYEILAAMRGPVAVDIETTGLRFARKGAMILSGALSDGDITMAWSIDHPEAPTDWGMQFLVEFVRDHKWIAHNSAFELVWILHARNLAGLEFEPAPFEDSMAIGRAMHERTTMLGLDVMSRMHLGIDFKSMVKVNRSNMINEPLERILPYNGLDAQASALIYRTQRKKVHEETYLRLLASIRSMAEMELVGLDLDPQANADLDEYWQIKLKEAQDQSRLIYEVRQFELNKQIEFNIGSNDHVAEALIEYGRVTLPKTNKGKGTKWSTDDQDLRAAAPDNPLVKVVLEYREAVKMKSTYIDPIRDAIENNFDGRIHPAYTCMLTATTRPSSEAPNVQNYPKRRHRELRLQVVAPPRHIFASFDAGQIEARGFGMASKDRNLCESIIKKIDIHSKWRDRALELYPDYIIRLAEKTNESDPKKILKGGRDIIKTDFVFSSFFGSTAKSCAARTGLPIAIVEKMLGEFWREYPAVAAWVKAKRREYAETGSARLLTGLARHEIMNGNEPLNTPIQGSTTGQMVLEAQNAMSEHARRLKDPYLHPRINIHDDLTFILPDDDADVLAAYIEFIGNELCAVRFSFQIVPLMWECKVGYNWSEFEECAEFIGDYVR